MSPRYPHRLRLKHIEATPKEVRFVGDTLDVRIKLSNETALDLADLRDLVQSGSPLPGRYYRPSMARRSDDLLFNRGIMHLHLKSHDDDTVVYLIQYQDHIVIICIDTHKHLRAHPPGAGLREDLILKAEKALLSELKLDPLRAPDADIHEDL